MKTLTDFLVVLSGFLVLGMAIAFGNWLGSQPLFGWIAFGGITALSAWGTIALWKSTK
jgi:hypothetical protein